MKESDKDRLKANGKRSRDKKKAEDPDYFAKKHREYRAKRMKALKEGKYDPDKYAYECELMKQRMKRFKQKNGTYKAKDQPALVSIKKGSFEITFD
jgi:hypothetical protein